MGAVLLDPITSAASVRRSHAPASVRGICRVAHIACTGRVVRFHGQRMFKLNQAIMFARGRAFAGHRRLAIVHSAATGCNTYGCTVQNQGGGKCWSDLGGTTNGTKIYLYDCDPNSHNQMWSVYGGYSTHAGYDYFSPQNAGNMCLNDPNGSTATGTQLQLWNCYSTKYETFEVFPVTQNVVRLHVDGVPLSGSANACLSDNGNANSGAGLEVANPCNTSSNQEWYSTLGW